MSKKSYKRNQNRLYREIKRRILAERALKFPVPIAKVPNIETFAIKNIVSNYLIRENEFTNEMTEFIRNDMANKLASKLVAEGFVEFFSSENRWGPIADVTEIEARIRVVKPL